MIAVKKKPLGVLELLGIAVGCIGMSRDDFDRCYFDEFDAICRAWREHEDAATRDAWERTRLLAAITIQPHVKKKVTPRQLVQPWDSTAARQKQSAPQLSPSERRKRFEKLIK